MAFTGSAVCNSFKTEVLQGIHNFSSSGGNAFKLALYTNSAALTKATTVYTVSGEVASGGGYTTAGNALTSVTPALVLTQHAVILLIPIGHQQQLPLVEHLFIIVTLPRIMSKLYVY